MARSKNLNFLNKYYYKQDEKTRFFIAIFAIGIIIFLVFAVTAPLKDELLSFLYPKPSSLAQDATTLVINGINTPNNVASLNGYDFSWNAGSIGLTDGAYAVMFVTTRDASGNIVDQHWLVGSKATEGLSFSGNYTFPVAGTAVITVWETNYVDCNGFSCNPNLAIHNSDPFVVPRIIPTPTPTSIPTPTPSPIVSSAPVSTPPPPQNYGNISGTVYSSVGGIVSGAQITVRTGRTNKTYYSNSFGIYSIPNLSPNSYNVTFSARSYTSQTVSISVTANTTTTRNVTLIKK